MDRLGLENLDQLENMQKPTIFVSIVNYQINGGMDIAENLLSLLKTLIPINVLTSHTTSNCGVIATSFSASAKVLQKVFVLHTSLPSQAITVLKNALFHALTKMRSNEDFEYMIQEQDTYMEVTFLKWDGDDSLELYQITPPESPIGTEQNPIEVSDDDSVISIN